MADRPKLLTATNDYLFKALMGRNEDLLQHFLTAVYPFLAQECLKIEIADTELLPAQAGRKRASLDLKLYMNDNRVIDLEMQHCNVKGLTKRMLFYVSLLYCNELHRAQNHAKLKHVISLWICEFTLFDYDKDCFHEFAYHDKKYNRDFPDSPEIAILEIPKFTSEPSDLNLWLKFFAASTEEEFMEIAQQSPVMAKAWTFIHNANLDDIERERALAFERSRISDMIERSEERKDMAVEIAKNFLMSGLSRELVSKNTGLSLSEVEKIVTEIEQ